MSLRSLGRWLGGLALAAIVAVLALLNFPQPLFAHRVSLGRLSLYSDRPFDPARGRALLAEVERRLATSSLDDRRGHDIFVANAEWRRRLVFLTAGGATGVNWAPLSENVFIRRADIDRGLAFVASGKPAPPPRTLAYYAAHEITHSFTARRLGPARIWNRRLPQWVREGYADYVGMGGAVDVDALYRRYRAGDPELSFERSHTYARFRMLVAYFLVRERWSADQLLTSGLSLEAAQARMDRAMAGGT